jgi:hypothetical protein
MSLTRRDLLVIPAAFGGTGLVRTGIASQAAKAPALLVLHNGTPQGAAFLAGAVAACADLCLAPPQSLEVSLHQAGAFSELQEELSPHAGALVIGLLEHGQMLLAMQVLRECRASLFFSADHVALRDAARHSIAINAGSTSPCLQRLLAEAAWDWPFALGRMLAGAPIAPRYQPAPSPAGEVYSLASFAAVL